MGNTYNRHSEPKAVFPEGRHFLLFLIACILISFYHPKNIDKGRADRIRMLDQTEAIIFLEPEKLDSMVNLIDTINISDIESARLSTVRGKNFINNGEFARAIIELDKADSIYVNQGDSYHKTINTLIKAFGLEYLKLFNTAAELYVECEIYFEKNQYDKFRFYATLGLLRLNKQLKINTDELLERLEKDIRNFDDPRFTGLLYSTRGIIETNDSLSINYYEQAKSEYIKIHNWPGVYRAELNMLFRKIRKDQSDSMQPFYNTFPDKTYPYKPTSYQRLRYNYAQAYLFAKQKNYYKAIDETNRVLKEVLKQKNPGMEADCINMLAFLYNQVGDYKNAYKMLKEFNRLKEKEMDTFEQVRLLALGSHYRFTKLENDRLKLKVRYQKSLMIFGMICLIFAIVFLTIWNSLKKSKLNQEILKLKNIEIEEQIGNLQRSLENSKEKNTELIGLASELNIKYLDSKEISAFKHKIDKNHVVSWVEFENHFYNLRPLWVELLKEKVPELTPADLKYCMCLYFNLNNFEISKLMNVGDSAVKTAKKRIRDRFSLNRSTEIYIYLKKVDNRII